MTSNQVRYALRHRHLKHSEIKLLIVACPVADGILFRADAGAQTQSRARI